MNGCNNGSCSGIVEMPVWSAAPMPSGCVIVCDGGSKQYAHNYISGNTDNPRNNPTTYSPVFDSFCELINYMIDRGVAPPPSFWEIEYFAKGQSYDCDVFVRFKDSDRTGKEYLLQSRQDGNDQHPDNRDAWKNHGDINAVLKAMLDKETGWVRTFDIWKECTGPNCASVYEAGDCVVELVFAGDSDDCGNAIPEGLIFEAVTKTTDRPSVGAAQDPATWLGPYTKCEWDSRPVGQTINGEPIKAGGTFELLTPDDLCDSFELVDSPNGCTEDCDETTVKQFCPKPIGTEQNGNNVIVGGEHELLTADAFSDVFELVDSADGNCTENCDETTVKRFAFSAFLKDCSDNVLALGSKVASCVDFDGLRVYVDEQIANTVVYVDEQITAITSGLYKDCSGEVLPKDSSVVSCDSMGDGLVFDAATGKYNVVIDTDDRNIFTGRSGGLISPNAGTSVPVTLDNSGPLVNGDGLTFEHTANGTVVTATEAGCYDFWVFAGFSTTATVSGKFGFYTILNGEVVPPSINDIDLSHTENQRVWAREWEHCLEVGDTVRWTIDVPANMRQISIDARIKEQNNTIIEG